MDWTQLYKGADQDLNIVFNKAYITSLFSIVSLACTIYLLKHEKLRKFRKRTDCTNMRLSPREYSFSILANFLELQYQLFEHGFDYATQNIIIGSYNMLLLGWNIAGCLPG